MEGVGLAAGDGEDLEAGEDSMENGGEDGGREDLAEGSENPDEDPVEEKCWCWRKLDKPDHLQDVTTCHKLVNTYN